MKQPNVDDLFNGSTTSTGVATTLTKEDFDEMLTAFHKSLDEMDEPWVKFFADNDADFDKLLLILPECFKWRVDISSRLIGKKIFFSKWVDEGIFWDPNWEKPKPRYITLLNPNPALKLWSDIP